MKHNFADIHCHPTTKPFFTQRGPMANRIDPFVHAPNKIVGWLLNALKGVIEKASEIKLATQSNFDALYEGGHRVVIISLTPPERGFFVMNQADDTFFDDAFKTFVAYKKVPFTGTIRNNVVNALTGFSIEDIEYCKKKVTNYYDDLLKAEYDFLLQYDGKKGKGGYTLRLVKNFAEMDALLANGNDDVLCVIISVEGAHSLYDAPGFGDLLRNQKESHQNDPDNFSLLANYMEGIDKLKAWAHAPFFITFYHHQWNGLGGHARSMNRLMTKLINQEEGINLGLNALGKAVIKKLLLNKNERRILIDIKHMSPRSRRDYYALLATDGFKDEQVPIICSHCGIVTKRHTLNEMIELADKVRPNA